MSRNRCLPMLLAAALVAQVVIVGRGHTHAHVAKNTHGHTHIVGHSHQHAASDSHEHSPLPGSPTDQHDCSICRHLALAAILTFEFESPAIGDVFELVTLGESLLVSSTATGLHRPRSPPELS